MREQIYFVCGEQVNSSNRIGQYFYLKTMGQIEMAYIRISYFRIFYFSALLFITLLFLLILHLHLFIKESRNSENLSYCCQQNSSKNTSFKIHPDLIHNRFLQMIQTTDDNFTHFVNQLNKSMHLQNKEIC